MRVYFFFIFTVPKVKFFRVVDNANQIIFLTAGSDRQTAVALLAQKVSQSIICESACSCLDCRIGCRVDCSSMYQGIRRLCRFVLVIRADVCVVCCCCKQNDTTTMQQQLVVRFIFVLLYILFILFIVVLVVILVLLVL